MTAADGSLSWRTLLGYGGLALPLAALNLPLYVFLPTFYSAELGLDLATVGGVLLLARLFDTVIDPLMGEFGDRVTTPFGQRRPWLVLATPLLLFASWKLFVPQVEVDALYLLTWETMPDVPLGRWGEPADVVGAAVWLASGAASYVTGAHITIDGGLTVAVPEDWRALRTDRTWLASST